MAFNDLGPVVWVDESASVTWWYQRDGGGDFGTQFASADIKISDPLNLAPLLSPISKPNSIRTPRRIRLPRITSDSRVLTTVVVTTTFRAEEWFSYATYTDSR
jgi:hypothetical protein